MLVKIEKHHQVDKNIFFQDLNMTDQAPEENVSILINPMPAVAAVEVRATVVSNGGTGIQKFFN